MNIKCYIGMGRVQMEKSRKVGIQSQLEGWGFGPNPTILGENNNILKHAKMLIYIGNFLDHTMKPAGGLRLKCYFLNN